MCLIDTVCTAYGLKEGVILHRFVEVHTLEDRSIESSEQLAGHDDELERVKRVTESVEEFVLLELTELVLLVFIGFVTGSVHYNSGLITIGEKLIELLLVGNTTCSVIYYNLTLETGRAYKLAIVLNDADADFVYSLRRSEERFNLGSFRELILLFIREVVLLCHFIESFLEVVSIKMQLDRNLPEV